MTIFGAWAEQLHVSDVARLVGGEPCRAAAILVDLIGDKECVYFIVRITTPGEGAGGALTIEGLLINGGLPAAHLEAAVICESALDTVTWPRLRSWSAILRWRWRPT